MQGDRANPRLSLRSLDLLGSDAELRERAEAALRDRDAHQVPGLHTGRDATGSVTVLLGDDGQVRDVTVARDWSRRIGAAGVGEALFEAYAAAVRSTLEATALAEPQQEPPPAEAASPQGPRGESAAHEAADQDWMRRVWQTLQDNDAKLEELARRPDGIADESAVSPHGSLTARHRAGSIVAITGDPDLIAELDTGQLQYEAHALLRSCGEIRSGTEPEVAPWTN